MSPERIRKLWAGDWRMRLMFGRGMISDDTEHTLMVAQALLAHPHDAAAFQRSLAWKLRWWFASLPGGVGLATTKACLRLWAVVPPSKSGVASGGSGPAMRSAVIGAFFSTDPERRRKFVAASSRLTHRGWQAETAALAVAEAAAIAIDNPEHLDPSDVLRVLFGLSREYEWQRTMAQIDSALSAGDSVPDFAHGLGLINGVSGYSLHVVPVAIYAWLRHPGDFRAALCAALDCGGDTDTVGAIVGALAGATCGVEAIPEKWLRGICDWPRSVAFIERLASRLAEQSTTGQPLGPVRLFWPGIIPRNALFLGAVLFHGLRRMAPPY